MSAAVARRAQRQSAAGLGVMIRLVVRRNRVRLAVWWATLVGMYAYVVVYYADTFTTPESLAEYAELAASPGMVALVGLSPAADTLGGAVWTKAWMSVVIALAIGMVFLVTRNGRADEELGRTELLRARVLGIHTGSYASWLVNGVLCVLVGVGVTVASIGFELGGTTSALILGASVTGVGLVGLGVGAVTGQLAVTSRSANALGAVIIVAMYLLRMIGDMGDGALTWASPIGWGQKMEPYATDRWWPVLGHLVLTAVLLAIAHQVEARRDLGAGVLPQRPGPATAPARYGTPWGLGVRMERNVMIGWLVAGIVTGLVTGSVATAMTDLITDGGPSIDDLLRGTGVSALVALLVAMVALITAAFALQTTLSLRADEASGVIEPQLAGAVSRWSWAVQRLLIPVVWSAVILAVSGAVLGAVYGASINDLSQLWTITGACLAYWPSLMVLVGLAVFLWGWVPRSASPVSWAVMGVLWIITMFGEVFGLPEWIIEATPIAATPYLPYEQFSATPLLVMTGVALALTAAGLVRFVGRDVQPA